MHGSRNAYAKVRAETHRMIEGEEGYDVEFKEGPKRVQPEDIVAFANGTGGSILVGVREVTEKKEQKGDIVGCRIGDEPKRSISDKANSCIPRLEVRIVAEGVKTGKPIYRIDIPQGDNKPYCTSGGTYKIRKDGQNVGIDPELMVSMVLRREEEQFIKRFKSAGEEILEALTQLEDRVEQVAYVADETASSAQDAAAVAEELAGEEP